MAIEDYRFGDGYMVILFNHTSDRYSDPNYYSEAEGKRVGVEKVYEDQLMEFSSHVLIKESVVDGAVDILVEKIPGFSKQKLRVVFNQLFKKVKNQHSEEFEMPHPDGSVDKSGNPRRIKFKILTDVVGVPSEKMINDIENGKIEEVELISRKKIEGWDDDGYIQEKRRRISISLTAPPGNRIESLRKLSGLAKQKHPDMERVRVKFSPPGLVEASESAVYDINDEDPVDCEYFNKSASLQYVADETSFSGLVDKVIINMREMLKVY